MRINRTMTLTLPPLMTHSLKGLLLPLLALLPLGGAHAAEGLFYRTEDELMYALLIECADPIDRAAFFLEAFPDPEWSAEDLLEALEPTAANLAEAQDHDPRSDSLEDLVALYLRAVAEVGLVPEPERGDAWHFDVASRYRSSVARLGREFQGLGGPKLIRARLLKDIPGPCAFEHPCNDTRVEWAEGLRSAPLPADELSRLEALLDQKMEQLRTEDPAYQPCSHLVLHMVWLNQTGSPKYLPELLAHPEFGTAYAQDAARLKPNSEAAAYVGRQLVAIAQAQPCDPITPQQEALLPYADWLIRNLREAHSVRGILHAFAVPKHPIRLPGGMGFQHSRLQPLYPDFLDILLIEPERGFSHADLRTIEQARQHHQAKLDRIEAALGGGADDDPAGSN